jgi:hypothetical protein
MEMKMRVQRRMIERAVVEIPISTSGFEVIG